MIVGIVGGGQLARMLALAGYPLGLRCLVLDPAPDACAGQVSELIQGHYDDSASLARLAARANVVTFDFENVPAQAARELAAQRLSVLPPPDALEIAQDRLAEKSLFQELDIPTPAFAAVSSLEELQAAVSQIGLPAVLKTRRLGYDGKGQRVLQEARDVEPAWEALSAPLILENLVPFQREVSILALRGHDGEAAFYPLVENQHREGILRQSKAPYNAPDLERQARRHANKLLQRLAYVGLLAIEFFVLDGQLLANEMAPRVHNSGHWTIEGAETSQFENHLRAICGLPLGSTDALGCAAMLNFIGTMPNRAALLAIPGTHFHDYGKSLRPGRKLGHVTLRADDSADLQLKLSKLVPLIEGVQ